MCFVVEVFLEVVKVREITVGRHTFICTASKLAVHMPDDSKSRSRVMTSRRRLLQTVGVAGSLSLAGCSGSVPGQEKTTEGSDNIDLGKIVPDKLVSKGPHGNEPVSVDQLKLTDSEVKEVKNGDFTVAVVYHYLKTDWTRLHRSGLEYQLRQLGFNIEGVYGASFEASKQVDILNTLAQKSGEIDGVISLPVDTVATSDAYKNVSENDIAVVFQGNVPEGFKHPRDYAGMVTVDNQALGMVSARLLHAYAGSGPVGKIEFSSPFYVVDEREKGAKQVFKNKEVDVAATNSFSDPSKVYGLAQNMLTANPDLKGMWTPWAQPPGMQVVRAAEAANKKDFAITSIDLGERQSVKMAKEGFMKGLAVGDPYRLGVNNANMMAKTLIGKETPAYASINVNAVIRRNLCDSYSKILNSAPPESVTKHYEEGC